jgi:glycolate oxidase iron-sulfur subunit
VSGPLHLDEDELVACVACGLCLPHRVTGLEAASPRGRITAMRAVDLHDAPIDATFRRVIDECVQCRGCEAACPSSARHLPRKLDLSRSTVINSRTDATASLISLFYRPVTGKVRMDR